MLSQYSYSYIKIITTCQFTHFGTSPTDISLFSNVLSQINIFIFKYLVYLFDPLPVLSDLLDQTLREDVMDWSRCIQKLLLTPNTLVTLYPLDLKVEDRMDCP